PSDVLKAEAQDAGRRDGEDVVVDVRPEARDVGLEPVERACPGAHLPRSGHDGAERRVGGGPHLKAGADRPRSCTGELEEGGGAEILRVAAVEADPVAQVQVESGPRVEALELVDAGARPAEAVVDRMLEPV